MRAALYTLYFFHFPGNSSTNPDVFSLKPSASTARRIIPENFSSFGFAVSVELGNKQTNSLTDRLAL